MEEEYSGVPLPLFKGRISQDWGAHEARLKAWLRIKGIPLHAKEAADVLLLSLESESHAALIFERALGVAGSTSFEEGVLYLRGQFDKQSRKVLAQTSARNALDGRAFRQRGRRQELVKDLVSDLELLFEKAGVLDDREQKLSLTRCFIEFPHVVRRLHACASYDEAVASALRWEQSQIRRGNDYQTRSHGHETREHERYEGDPRPPSRQRPTTVTSLPIPEEPHELVEGEHLQTSRAPSAIEESPETEGFIQPEIPKLDTFPFRSSPTKPAYVSGSHSRNSSSVLDEVKDPVVERRYDNVTCRQPHSRSRVRSQSVDITRLYPQHFSEDSLGVPVDEQERASSTPPFVHEAMHSDEERSETPTEGRRPRKLTKKPSTSRYSRDGGSVFSGSTITGHSHSKKPSRSMKNWLVNHLGKGKVDSSSERGSQVEQDRQRSRSELAFRSETPDMAMFAPGSMGRPPKPRGGGRADA